MKTVLTDEALMAGILQGGQQQEICIKHAYEQFFSIVRNGKNRYPDLPKESLLNAYHSAIISMRRSIVNQQFRAESSLKTYLNKIFLNKCIDILRKNSSIKEETVAELPEPPPQRPEALRSLINEEEFNQLLNLMEKIGDTCRKIILDAEYWGYSSSEIAQRIGFSNAASVNSKKHTCLQKLRDLLINS